VSKHAAVGFAEWLSVTYGDRGIGVSCLCPMGVKTALLDSGFGDDNDDAGLTRRAVTTAGEVLDPDDVAQIVLHGIATRRFLILPHTQVLDFYRHKAADYDHWITGMRTYKSTLT
jgi:NAD(P)-dependent dehydrogenase (short-subunit alcohol dehydrogenase family)